MQGRATFAAVLVITGTASANSPVAFLPPLEVDVATDSAHGAALARGNHELLVGTHFASLAWWPTKLDVGVGVIAASRELTRGFAPHAAFDDPPALALDGEYVTIGGALPTSKHSRAWLTVRGERLHVTGPSLASFHAYGAALRLGYEVFGTHSLHDRDSAIVGTFGLGVYVELTHRELPPELGPDGVSLGLLLRLPMIVAGR